MNRIESSASGLLGTYQDCLLKLAWFFTYDKSRHFPDLQVSKTFGILNLDEATIYGSKLRTIIFAEKLRDRSKILQLKTSYISLTSVTVKCRFVVETL